MKTINKFIFSIAVILTIFTLTDVYAENYSASNFVAGDYIPNMYIKKLKADGSGQYKQGRIVNKIDDNSFVYCLQPFVEIDNNQTYQVAASDYATILQMSKEQWNRIRLLAYYGYQYGNHTDLKWYYVTQVLIWRTVDPTANIFFTNTLNGTRNDNLYAEEIAEIENLVANHLIKPSFNETSFNMMLGDSVILTDSNNVLNHYNITSTINVTAEILNNTLIINATDVGNGSINLQKTDIKYNIPPLVYYSPYSQDAMTVGYYDPVPATISLNIEGGQIRITKVDSETNQTIGQGNATLVGAKYQVLNSNNEIVSTLTIGNDSTAITSYLPIGTYTIHEIEESTGYYRDTTVYTVNVTSSGIFDITVKEKVIKGKIKIIKFDRETQSCNSQGQATLVGAKYQILDSNNNVVDTVTIDSNCTGISKDLPYGDYKIKEIEAPKGYNLSGDVLEITLRNENTATIYTEDSVIKGRIQLLKIDSETGTTQTTGEGSLSEAEYGIYDNNNNLVDTLIIDNTYQAISEYLPYGTYKIKELKAGLGYNLDSTIYEITIDEENSVISVTSKEEVIKGRIKLIKIDKDTSTSVAQGEATLVGAKYQILDSNNNVVDTLIIGNDCTATSKLLPYGKYKIKEISSSKGYHLNTEIYSQFVEEELIYSVEVEEEVIKNQFNFYKFYGNESTGIIYSEANALFEVVNKEGIVVTTFKTDKNGYAKLILPYGDYVVKQVSGLEDYQLMYPFSISVSETTSLNQTNYLKNGPITARLKLIKIDSETGLSINIAGARFKIKNQKTNEYICQTTDKIICEFETNENGIMITPLPLFGGDYIIEEIKAPNGYILSNEELIFSLKENQDIIEDEVYGSMIEVVFENTQVKGNLIIHKTGEKVEIKDNTFIYKEIDLSDVVFEIRANEDIIIGSKKYYSKDELVATLKNNENGIIELSNLPLGKYTVKEISTKDNHILDSTIYELELKYQDQYTEIIYKELEIKNSLQTGELEFTKTDLITGEVIPNVKVNIYTENDKLIYSGFTDKEGKIIIKDLFVGKFYIVETETAEGYVLSPEKVYFEIKENGKIVKANMTNKKISSKIIFHKIDENGNSLAGVKIGIYDLDENEIGIYTTNEKGIIEVELEYNKYMYKELETLNGYILDEEKHYFNVTQDGEVIELNLINKLKEIEIPNTSSNSNFISISVLMLGIGIVLFIISNKKNKKV